MGLQAGGGGNRGQKRGRLGGALFGLTNWLANIVGLVYGWGRSGRGSSNSVGKSAKQVWPLGGGRAGWTGWIGSLSVDL